MYGYVRLAVSDGTVDDERIRVELRSYAEREGFSLGQVFFERFDSMDWAFQRMLDEIKRAGVKNLLVPSLWHFARLPGLQDAMKCHIEEKTGARLWVVQGKRR